MEVHKLKGKSALAYTAGIIDGEGTITIIKSQNKRRRNGYRLSLSVRVGSTTEWLPQWLKMQYGGALFLYKHKSPNKDLWTWQLVARQAASFLKLILPYLNIKRPQAELAIAFESKMGTRRRLTEEELAVREAEHILMRKMNQRGRSDGTVSL